MASGFSHHHLLDIERLTVGDIETVLSLAETYATHNRAGDRKWDRLCGKAVVNLFFEPSTRTRTSFEIAAKRLGADVVNVPLEHSSAKKGETLSDTVLTLDAMGVDALIIRHAESGIPQFVAPMVKASVINAGDGVHEHPTQALLDALTIRRHKGRLQGLTIAICGDIAHSRVARSNVWLLTKLGAKVRLIAPPYFANTGYTNLGVETFDDMAQGLQDADAVMMLRIQHERFAAEDFAVSLSDYHRHYRLDHKKLTGARPDVIVLHPGPVNRDVELTGELADDPAVSVIREQVELGVAVRMAVLDLLLGDRV